jgi:hypothetical protein
MLTVLQVVLAGLGIVKAVLEILRTTKKTSIKLI